MLGASSFGGTLFAHAPRLHTFLLSDAPYKWRAPKMPFAFAAERDKQLSWLEEWDKHTSALESVANRVDKDGERLASAPEATEATEAQWRAIEASVHWLA